MCRKHPSSRSQTSKHCAKNRKNSATTMGQLNIFSTKFRLICYAIAGSLRPLNLKQETTLIFPLEFALFEKIQVSVHHSPPKRPLTSGFTGCFNYYCGHFTLPFYSVFHVNNTTSSNFSQNDLFLSKFTLLVFLTI